MRTMERQREAYDIKTASRILKTTGLQGWLRNGIITEVAFVGDGYLSKDYIDTLSVYLELERKYGDKFGDPRKEPVRPAVTMFNLSREYIETKQLSRVARVRAQRQIEIQIKCLVESEVALLFDDFVVMMRPYIARSGIMAWLHKKALPAYLINKRYYMHAVVAFKIVWFYRECKTLTELAKIAQIDVHYLERKVRNGELPVLYGPTRHLPRFTPETVMQIVQEQPKCMLTYAQAAQRLGVNVNTVGRYFQKRLRADPIKRSTIPCIPEAEVQEWEVRFATLNPGYEWLSRAFGNRTPLTYNSSQVKRILGISDTTLSVYCKEGLLPFYSRSFSITTPNRQFVQLYVKGLLKYSKGYPQRHARDYLRRCQERGIVV